MDAAGTFDGVIINADSMQVYRELRLITARPSPADERAPRIGCTVCFRRGLLFGWTLAPACEGGGRRCLSAGRLPIVVGGTGPYLKALLEGLADVPPIPAQIRMEAEALYAEGQRGIPP